ncbi:MAG: TonB C-terminal domain-containing protein, partial [Candidatus Obscuribacterales bacterium]|nr:TonB C-terminal domain-containing protein [Candidatus Obscuribacterales bacterium]
AGRWHRNLRYAERMTGLKFQTPRPALIQFSCYADGSIRNVVLRQSSGVPAYDRLQIAALMQTAPLAPFPQGTVKRSITLLQGWESHFKRPGEEDFQAGNFADRYPKEKVSRWVKQQ